MEFILCTSICSKTVYMTYIKFVHLLKVKKSYRKERKQLHGGLFPHGASVGNTYTRPVWCWFLLYCIDLTVASYFPFPMSLPKLFSPHTIFSRSNNPVYLSWYSYNMISRNKSNRVKNHSKTISSKLFSWYLVIFDFVYGFI